LDYLKQIKQQFGEWYADGLSRNQKILAGVVLGLLAVGVFLWIFNFGAWENASERENPPAQENKNGGMNDSGQEGRPTTVKQGYSTATGWIGNPAPVPTSQPTGNDSNQDNSNPVRQIQLPEIPTNTNRNASPAPGPLDPTIARLKANYQNSPKYNLIVGYLAPLKDIGDGRRAWTDWFRQSAVDLFGKKQAQEIEAEINRLNGNKEARIRNSHYDTLDEVSAAVQKDTASYIEKAAINGFLDQAKISSAGKYPWTETMVGAGEYNLEQAWVDQVDAKVRATKEAKARQFLAANYPSLDALITAIKQDTQNYEQIPARDMFLDYIKQIYGEHKLTEPDVLSGGGLLDDYHLAALKKFVNK